MKTKPVFVHIRNTQNLGDLSCCPADSFSVFDQCDRIDFSQWNRVPAGVPLIFGGGGLFMMHTMHVFAKAAKTHPVAIWGAGLNFPTVDFTPAVESALVGYLKQCTGPIGVRNPEFAARHGFKHVACPSVLSHQFDQALSNRRPDQRVPLLAYEHIDARFAGSRYPALTNNHGSFHWALRHLVRASTVVTNSYHGAYWATLLGARVALWNPEQFGNRFTDLGFGQFPTVKSFFEVEQLKFRPEFPFSDLNESRQSNTRFIIDILSWLECL